MSTPKEVCPTCKGTGTFRWTHRLTGAKSGTCATCMGSGKNSPVAAAAILNDLSPGTAEQRGGAMPTGLPRGGRGMAWLEVRPCMRLVRGVLMSARDWLAKHFGGTW